MGYRMPLTLSERKEIKKLLGTMSLTKIAERMNRSKNGIVTEVRNNGGLEEYDPVKAHKMVEVRLKENKDRQLAMIKKQNNDQTFLHEVRRLKEDFKEIQDDHNFLMSQYKKLEHDFDEVYNRLTGAEEFCKRLDDIDLFNRKLNALKKTFKEITEKLDKGERPRIEAQAGTHDRLIELNQWHNYHKWPHRDDMRKLITKREQFELGDAVVKLGKRWYIDEGKFFLWAPSYKERIIKASEKIPASDAR